MIKGETIRFLENLKANNSREWFISHRATYDLVKNDVLQLAEQLICEVSAFDSGIAGAHLDPKKCITRLNRDLRFSRDKTPYKTEYYIVLNPHGKNSPSAFYYLHVEPGNCSVGGGIYNPLGKELHKIREKIDASFQSWQKIIGDRSFQKTFPSGLHHSGVLVRLPRGFDDSSLAKDYLKMKGFFTMEPITDEAMQSNQTLSMIIDCFKAVKPLVDFINHALET